MLLDTHRNAPPHHQQTNTFIALRPPRDVAEQFYARATQLCSRADIVGSQRPPSILHMTVLSIAGCRGRLPSELLEKIDAAISMVRFSAIDVVLDEAQSFATRKANAPFVLEGDQNTDVLALRLFAGAALCVKGHSFPARGAYTPHMTIAYARRRSPRMKVDPFCWRAREFQLIESWVGQTKYVELARWSLRDALPCEGVPTSAGPLPITLH